MTATTSRIVGHLTGVTRLQNSASGNPRLELELSGPNSVRRVKSTPDAQFVYTAPPLEELIVLFLNHDGEAVRMSTGGETV